MHSFQMLQIHSAQINKTFYLGRARKGLWYNTLNTCPGPNSIHNHDLQLPSFWRLPSITQPSNMEIHIRHLESFYCIMSAGVGRVPGT